MFVRIGVMFGRHLRFYLALGCGLLAFAVGLAGGLPAAALVGGDVFYAVFLGLCLAAAMGQTAENLKSLARAEDDGILIVILITGATMAYFCAAVFEALARKQGIQLLPLVLAGIGAPLGWAVLHAVMAFHYANLHYFDDPDAPDEGRDLDFPGRGEPDLWDFLYFSFVIGMTAQVSDVQVKTTVMRKAVLGHGLASFFFNTVFIAMAVNAAVATAS